MLKFGIFFCSWISDVIIMKINGNAIAEPRNDNFFKFLELPLKKTEIIFTASSK